MPRPEDELHDAYAAFGRRVYRYCLFRLGSPEDAEDVTAEVFVRMMRARHPKGDELLPWLLRVAHNACTDEQRRAQRRRTSEERLPRQAEAVEVEWPDPEAYAALRDLPDRQRQAVWLKAVEDLTFEQVARLMRRRTGAVKMLYYRGIDRLRERMEGAEDARDTG